MKYAFHLQDDDLLGMARDRMKSGDIIGAVSVLMLVITRHDLEIGKDRSWQHPAYRNAKFLLLECYSHLCHSASFNRNKLADLTGELLAHGIQPGESKRPPGRIVPWKC
jgi:hypothetical protein